jgi:polyisoprenyl-teichoic acid--peptidoglycan teichoic acid transferase
MEKRTEKNKKRKKKKKGRKLKIFLIILLTIILLFGSAFAGMYFFTKGKLNNIERVDIPKDPSELGIDTTKVSTDSNIKNILLMGIDSRDPKVDPGHSDALMILTVDEKHNKLKISSIMRDSYVKIERNGSQKITNAHQFGGALLSIKTVNENYDMDIMDYVQVNFFGLEKIIDSVKGVQVNVSGSEISLINGYMTETSKIEKKTPIEITKSGLQTLNGMQAVAYCRIRYVGNNDFQRTERQRTVLTAVFKKLSSTNITDIPKAADAITPYVQTSLKPDDMMSLATYILTHKMTSPIQTRVPYDGLYKDAVINGADVLTWDKDANIKKLHQFIFEDGK